MEPVVKRLEKRDAAMCKAFKNIVLQGKFEVQGAAQATVGSLFQWFNDLDKRIEETLKPIPGPPIIRQMSEGELTEAREAHAKEKKKKK